MSHSFPTRRSSDLTAGRRRTPWWPRTASVRASAASASGPARASRGPATRTRLRRLAVRSSLPLQGEIGVGLAAARRAQLVALVGPLVLRRVAAGDALDRGDRKRTPLNSSH